MLFIEDVNRKRNFFVYRIIDKINPVENLIIFELKLFAVRFSYIMVHNIACQTELSRFQTGYA